MKHVDIEQVLAEIREDVESKRAQGLYPPGLEQELEFEFQSILSLTRSGISDRMDEIGQVVDRLRQKNAAISGLTAIQSRIPFISLLHRIVRRLVARQTMGLAAQIRAAEADKVYLLELLVEQSKAQEDADQRLVRNLTKHVMDRVAVVDHLAVLVAALEFKIRNLEENR